MAEVTPPNHPYKPGMDADGAIVCFHIDNPKIKYPGGAPEICALKSEAHTLERAEVTKFKEQWTLANEDGRLQVESRVEFALIPLLKVAWKAGVMARANSSSIFTADTLALNPYGENS